MPDASSSNLHSVSDDSNDHIVSNEMLGYRLNELTKHTTRIEHKLDKVVTSFQEINLWKVSIEGRLADGNRQFTETDKALSVSDERCRGEIKAIHLELEKIKEETKNKFVEKSTIIYIALGAALVSGGGIATILGFFK